MRLVIFSAFLVVAAFSAESSTSWGYGEDNGPSKWGENFPTCQNGQKQSPINIETESTIYQTFTPFEFTGFATPRKPHKFENSHFTWRVLFDPPEGLSFSGGDLPSPPYELQQFHIHWSDNDLDGTEHQVDGREFSMEMHIIGKASSQDVHFAVLGVRFDTQDDDNPAFNAIVDNIDQIKYDSTHAEEFQGFITLDDFLPVNRARFYRYEGSLTTPGCDEFVTWTVFDEVKKIGRNQLNAFRELLGPNNVTIPFNDRPVQPINGRTVYRSHRSLKSMSDRYSSCCNLPKTESTKC